MGVNYVMKAYAVTLILWRPQHALNSRAQESSPSLPAEGGEGRGEEGYSACGRRVEQQWDAPLPGPLPARSSRGEGVGAVAHPAASSVYQRRDATNAEFQMGCIAGFFSAF